RTSRPPPPSGHAGSCWPSRRRPGWSPSCSLACPTPRDCEGDGHAIFPHIHCNAKRLESSEKNVIPPSFLLVAPDHHTAGHVVHTFFYRERWASPRRWPRRPFRRGFGRRTSPILCDLVHLD